MLNEWFESTIEVPAEYGDIVGNFLIENGAPGFQSEDCDGLVRLTAYFVGTPPVDELSRFCAAIGCPIARERIIVRTLPYENWAENWKLHFRPQAVGEQLYVCPPWDCTPPAGRVAIVIDPGMAFGTGQHATTRGCLLLIEAACREGSIGRALDVGTGSGVLAIALAKLGVTEVCAIDSDPAACAIAEANIRHNGVESAVSVCGGLSEISGSFDLIVANLFANLLEQMAAKFITFLRPGGVFVCSGFLTADEGRVRDVYAAVGVQVTSRYEEQSWVTLAMPRREP